MNSGLLAGKVVGVSGAGMGIGRATALLASSEDAAGLVLIDRDEAQLNETAGLLVHGCEATLVAGDVLEPGMGDRFVAAAVDRFGRLDCAVNNVGTTGTPSTIDSMSDEEWDEVVNINLRSMFQFNRAQLAHMYQRGSGAVVNVASAGIFGVVPQIGHYVASKHGVVGLTTVAAKEAGAHGVRVNAVCPGRTDTAMTRAYASRPDTPDPAAGIPLGRLGAASEIAEAIVWLCSDRSSFVTGASLVADGGRTI